VGIDGGEYSDKLGAKAMDKAALVLSSLLATFAGVCSLVCSMLAGARWPEFLATSSPSTCIIAWLESVIASIFV
jgi:hypothetical protein